MTTVLHRALTATDKACCECGEVFYREGEPASFTTKGFVHHNPPSGFVRCNGKPLEGWANNSHSVTRREQELRLEKLHKRK